MTHQRYTDSLINAPRNINPLEDHFDRRRILLSEFFSPYNAVVRQKTFRNCEIFGPGSMVLRGTNLNQPLIMNSDFVVIEQGMIHSAVGFDECSFINCKFYAITILLNRDAAKEIIRDCTSRGLPLPPFFGAPIN